MLTWLVTLFLLLLSACSPSREQDANTIRVAILSNIKSFDPAQASDQYSIACQNQVYEALYEYHYLARPYRSQPLLARALPTVTDSGLTYILPIRTDVYFQDDACFPGGLGRRMTARDFVYSVKRLADVRTQTTGWWVLDGKVEGLDAWRQASEALPDLPDPSLPELYSRPIAGLSAPDDSTVVMRLTHAYPYFKDLLAMPYLAVVPVEAVLHYGEEFLNHPVGTGPYRLTEWRRSLRLRFSRNEKYHAAIYPLEGMPGDSAAGLLRDAGQILPLTDRLDIGIFEESQPMWLNFLRGRLDRASIPKDNYNDAVTSARVLRPELARKGIRLLRMRELRTDYISFNLKDSVLGKHKGLRQAMALAYDVEEVIERFSNGRAIRAQSPIPPGLFGYDSLYVGPYGHFDLEAAKSRLAASGFPSGAGLPALEYLAVSGTDTRQLGEYFVQSMARLGLQVKLVSCTWPEYLDRLRKGKFQIVGASWGADYPDPENFLQLLYGPNEPPGENNSAYRSEAYDKAYRAMAVMPDSPQRLALIRQMQELVSEDCPWILTRHRIQESLVQGRLDNVQLNAVMEAPYKYYRVKP